MALCVWPCNCYEKERDAEPDLMWDLEMRDAYAPLVWQWHYSGIEAPDELWNSMGGQNALLSS